MINYNAESVKALAQKLHQKTEFVWLGAGSIEKIFLFLLDNLDEVMAEPESSGEAEEAVATDKVPASKKKKK